MHCVYRGDAQPRAQHPVERARSTTALHVTEDRDLRVDPGAPSDFGRDDIGDPAQLDVPVLIVFFDADVERAFDRTSPFGYDDDGGVTTALVAAHDCSAYRGDVERLFR